MTLPFCEMESEDEAFLRQIYYNPKYATAFSGFNKLWLTVKSHGKNISRQQLQDWLASQDVYTSHHPIVYRFKRRRVITRGINDVWDADLADMSGLSEENDDVSYLLIVIDIFSRYLYVEPMKNKSNASTLAAIKRVFGTAGSQPETFRSDAGKEFLGKGVKNYLGDREIYQQVTQGDKKANYAERAIRTIKGKIYKYLYYKRTKRYIDVLSDLVQGYNNCYHRGIKMMPSDVTKENEMKVWSQQYVQETRKKTENRQSGESRGIRSGSSSRTNRRKANARASVGKLKFKRGDMVRVSNARTPFSRGFGQTFSEEIFRVEQCFPTVPPTYMLKDLNGEKVRGLFYDPEMVLVKGKTKDSEYLMEKILARRTVKGQKQVLIKWKGYSNAFNSWEPESNLVPQ